MSCSTTISECLPASVLKSSAVRSVSASVMPATGSSRRSRRGSCISSMPISSHCFWPCERSPASRSGAPASWICSSVAAIRSPCAESSFGAQALPHALVGFHRELEILEHRVLLEHRGLLELAADPGMGDLRFGHAQQVDGLAEERRTRIRPGLARDHVHHGGLARAVRPDDATQFAGFHREREIVQRLETVEADGDVVKIDDRPVRDVERLGDHAAAADRRRPAGALVIVLQRGGHAVFARGLSRH